VHGKIAINKQNEWSRTYNNETQGMRSPVLQAEEQGKILRALLIDNKQKLLSKLLGTLQKGFAHCPINIYVAISDAGIIERKTTIDELFKADQISNEIEEKLKKLKNLYGPLSLSFEGGWSISTEEVKKVADFLFLQHQPLHKANIKNQEAISKIAETKSLPPITKATSEKTFIPKAGATCPVCNQHKLIRKSVPRSDGTKTDFLACAGYPIECKTIFPLVAIVKKVGIITNTGAENNDLKENDTCPRCKTGKLLLRKAKTEFLGCSQYPKCKFTDYHKLA
jgi:ssDNA-binding Zn-finger/Zn-ribbon topoisomerase 1